MAQVLRPLHASVAARHPGLVVGIAAGDDAGVFRAPCSSDGVLLVQTVDFFTPIVDEAGDWGRIAAANALSDVYAMGGRPLTALQLVAWPRDRLPFELLSEVLAGGAEVLEEAECALAGGHSIDDPEPKYGLAVTGLVTEEQLMRNAAARPGDILVLTKPLGTGVVATAIKRGVCPSEVRDAAVASMRRLNAAAAEVATVAGVRAATDITGFGLVGHLHEILASSATAAVLEATAVPFLPGARELAEAGIVPGGTGRNLEAVAAVTDWGTLDVTTRTLLTDAQTSGGLLLCVPEDRVDEVTRGLAAGGDLAAVVGRLEARQDGPRLVVR